MVFPWFFHGVSMVFPIFDPGFSGLLLPALSGNFRCKEKRSRWQSQAASLVGAGRLDLSAAKAAVKAKAQKMQALEMGDGCCSYHT